jgi:hypothetical protein
MGFYTDLTALAHNFLHRRKNDRRRLPQAERILFSERYKTTL